MAAISATPINQLYASLQIPLVQHSGAFTDWLKFVSVVTYHFCVFCFLFSLMPPPYYTSMVQLAPLSLSRANARCLIPVLLSFRITDRQSWALSTFLYLSTKYMLEMYLSTKYFSEMYFLSTFEVLVYLVICFSNSIF